MIKKLSQKDFLETFRLVPRVAVNLVIKNGKGEILLTKRAIPPMVGYWHIPGGFLVKGERLLDCIKRIAKKEIGLNINTSKAKLIGVFEDLRKDSRGHIVDIMYGIEVADIKPNPTPESEDIRFFKDIPEKIGFNHKDYLLYITKHWIS